MLDKLFKKGLVFGITIIFIMSTFSNIHSSETVTLDDKQIKVIKSDVCKRSVFMKGLSVRQPLQHISKIESFDQYQVTDIGCHPALAKDNAGTLLAAYEYQEDPQESYVYWTYSTDDGTTWNPGIYYGEAGNYPTLDYWGSGNRFFGIYGTFQTHDITLYLLECTDPTDYDTYEFNVLMLWDWINYLKDIELACDNSQGYDDWGVLSFIASRQAPHLVDLPHLLGPGDKLYYLPLENCAHTSIDIDHNTFLTYALYDCYDSDEDKWKLLVWIKDFSYWGWPGEEHIISGAGNLQHPTVASYDDNLAILVETDENGNKDIICYYSDNGIINLKKSFVTTDRGDERFPDVQHISDNIFGCTFIKDGKLYLKITEDGGATWNHAEEIDECEEEYKASDMSEKGAQVIYKKEEGVYIADVFLSGGPSAPMIDGPKHGRIGKPYDYKFMSIDHICDYLIYYIIWGDGTTSETGSPSGENVTVSHTWYERGDYWISARAENEYGVLSPSSDPFLVSMPRNKATYNLLFLQFLERFPLLERFLFLLIK